MTFISLRICCICIIINIIFITLVIHIHLLFWRIFYVIFMLQCIYSGYLDRQCVELCKMEHTHRKVMAATMKILCLLLLHAVIACWHVVITHWMYIAISILHCMNDILCISVGFHYSASKLYLYELINVCCMFDEHRNHLHLLCAALWVLQTNKLTQTLRYTKSEGSVYEQSCGNPDANLGGIRLS